MKKIILSLIITFLSINLYALADLNPPMPHKPKPTHKEQKEFSQLLDERLNFTPEQKAILKQNRKKNRKEMEKIVKEMEKLHNEIKVVYLSGIPKYQADIKTSTKKIQLVLLKQEADNLRKKHREEFEKILTDEQKVEFEKFKKELLIKKN